MENVILQAVVLGKSALLDVPDLPKRIVQAPVEDQVGGSTLSDRLTEPEKQILIDTIRENRGNIIKSAEALQISRTTLYATLKKYQIDPATIY